MFTTDLYTDLKWLHNISYKLDKFKKSSPSSEVYNARCPFCGDSEKSSKKTRLYFYTKKGSLNFDCKNCGEHGSFFKFMRLQCPNEFEEYKRDQLHESLSRAPRASKRSKVSSKVKLAKKAPGSSNRKPLQGVMPVLDLPENHEALKYLKTRSFGERELKRLLYSENFKETAQSISEDELKETFPEEPRIVIPFYDKDGNIEVIQGRALNPKSSLRYITIKSNEDVDKVYGKYELDRSRPTYCVEGPFDSLFVDNCLATCDSNLLKVNVDVYIWDNQPRNKEVIALMEEAITKGKNVVVWPASPNNKMDINDMIKMGLSREDLMSIIHNRTFSGLKAKLEINNWRKV